MFILIGTCIFTLNLNRSNRYEVLKKDKWEIKTQNEVFTEETGIKNSSTVFEEKSIKLLAM
jgi:hypothetical protein